MLGGAMAESKKKAKYITKTVKFGDKQFTLFSLDGITWSSRREELHQILERQEQERKSFNQLLGDQGAEKTKAPAAEGEAEEGEDERLLEAEADEILPLDTPARGKIKTRPIAVAKAAAKAPVEKAAKEAAPTPAPKKKGAKGKAEKVIAAPKARASSKPAKKASKGKTKKKVA